MEGCTNISHIVSKYFKAECNTLGRGEGRGLPRQKAKRVQVRVVCWGRGR